MRVKVARRTIDSRIMESGLTISGRNVEGCVSIGDGGSNGHGGDDLSIIANANIDAGIPRLASAFQSQTCFVNLFLQPVGESGIFSNSTQRKGDGKELAANSHSKANFASSVKMVSGEDVSVVDQAPGGENERPSLLPRG